MTSYRDPLKKAGGGFGGISQTQGDILHQTGVWAGWQNEGEIKTTDPRPVGSDPRELGRGPLSTGQWTGIRMGEKSAKLNYRIGDAEFQESFTARRIGDSVSVIRQISVSPLKSTLQLVLGDAVGESEILVSSTESQELEIHYVEGLLPMVQRSFTSSLASSRGEHPWLNTMVTKFAAGAAQGAFAVDELALPYPNIWERRIRPADITFSPQGIAWVITFDGDVYRLKGLMSSDNRVEWKRIAAGFNEPMSIVYRDGDLFVLSRNGITELIDGDGDEITDFYRLFSNAYVQSPGGRGFVFSLEGLPDGGFLVSTGGQQPEARAPHGGRVLQISPDGENVTVVATGFRNPWITRDPTSGQVFASDQQGHWVPSTPFHVVRPENFYGHNKSAPHENAPITAPHLWFPYFMAQSGVGMVMGFDERAGPLNGRCFYIEYKTPGGLIVNIPDAGEAQTSAIPLPVKFEVPLLKGEVNPVDGQAYLVGFQIWDAFAPRFEGISRLRVISPETNGPKVAEGFSEGLLLDYDKMPNEPVFEVRAWNYQRTKNYGSPQFKMNGEPGFEVMPVHSVIKSTDDQSLFLAIDDMPAAMTIVVTQIDGDQTSEIYTTANQMETLRPTDHGLPSIDFAELFQEPVTATQPSAVPNVVSVGCV